MSPNLSVVLQSRNAQLTIEPGFGGRVSSWKVGEVELLWQPDGPLPGASHPFGWGSFVMAPFAGRIRRGVLRFDEVEYRLPIAMEPHAIHGTVYDSVWRVDELWSGADRTDPAGPAGTPGSSGCVLACSLGDEWPFRGVIHQRVELFADDDSAGFVSQHLWLDAEDAMPVTMGWHPWFPRHLAGASGPLQWSFNPVGVQMFQRDADGIATANLVDIPPGPWDDCFSGVGDVLVRWPDLIDVTISHDCPVVVLFDGLDHAVCVEPQTGPPDGATLWPDRVRVQEGSGVGASTRWSWSVVAKNPAA